MASAFNLTAQINLQGPANLRTVVADIRRQLGSITVDINPQINAAAARNVASLSNDLRTLNSVLNNTVTASRSAAQAINNLGNAINSVGGRNIQQNMNAATAAAQNLSRNITSVGQNTQRAATQMEEFGRQSALAIRRFAAFSIVTSAVYSFINAVSKGVDEFIKFDKEFVRLQQVTGESAKGLQSLASEISRLATQYGVASNSLTQVSVTLAQAGLTAGDTKRALEALAQSALSPSFDDMNETVEGSIALMRQFGISATDLGKALGSVSAVSAQFAVEASDIITAIQRTGGVFATASKGVSQGSEALNEFIALFTSVRQTTRESAETIATGLRTIFTRIQRGDTIDALKEFGVTLTDLEGKFVGPFEAVKRLSIGLKSLDPRDLRFSAIVEELGGFRQIGKVIPLIQQFAVAQQALKVAQQGQGILAKDAATAQLSLANQIAKVREEFLALIRSIGESDSFKSFVNLSLQLASALIRVADAAKDVLPAIAAISTIKGISALTQFGSGFARGLTRPRGFATGGYVPGSGNRDTVPAMLTPGEFVIRKKAVETIGVNRLQNLNTGGGVQKFARGSFVMPKARGVAGARGARSRFKDLTEEELAQLSTADMIKYAKAQARDIFSSGGAGIATSSKFIPVSKERITPELESSLTTYLGQKGFWKEQVSPFGKPNKMAVKAQGKMSREEALKKQQSRMADEVAARSQQWTSIRSGSAIDNYLLSSLKDPILSDYRTVRGGGSLSKPFYNTRLRQAVNKSLESYDDFDYSAGNIDKLVSNFAAKKFASGGLVQKFAEGGAPLRQKMSREERILQGMDGGQTRGGRQIYNFGVAALRRGGRREGEPEPASISIEPFTIPGKPPKKAQFSIGTLSTQGLDKQIESILSKGFIDSVSTAANTLGSQIGSKPIVAGAAINRILKGSGFQSVIGAGLEASIASIGSPYIDKTEKTKMFDFPLGLGSPATLFGLQPNIPTDVTRTIGGFGKNRSTLKDAAIRFVNAIEGGEFTKARKDKINTYLEKRKLRNASPITSGQDSLLSSIFDDLGSGTVRGGADLRAKYGFNKLTKKQVFEQLPLLSELERKSFLEEFRRAVPVRRKLASGGSIQDTVPALLTPGEFVINKKAASRIGASRLHNLNRADKIQGFNKGGAVGHVQKFASGRTVNPGDFEARVQRILMMLEQFEKNIYEGSRAAGQTASKAKEAARIAAGYRLSSLEDSAESREVSRRYGQQGAPQPSTFSSRAQQYQQASMNAAPGIKQDAFWAMGKFNSIVVASSNALNKFGTTVIGVAQNTGRFGSQIASNPIGTFLKAIAQATNGLYNLSKASIGTIGGAGASALGLGGYTTGAGGAGLGLGSSNMRQQARALRAQGLRGSALRNAMMNAGGGGGGMLPYMLPVVGGLAVDSISQRYGGETTDTGRFIGNVGSSAINYGATGAMIGSIIPGVGTGVGALAGITYGVYEGLTKVEEASKEYAEKMQSMNIERVVGANAQNISSFASNSNLKNRAAALQSLQNISAEEDKLNLVRSKTDTDATFARRIASSQQSGGNTAAQFLNTEIIRTGKTYSELASSLDPSVVKNIVEADETYVKERERYNRLLQEQKDRGLSTDSSATVALQKERDEALSGLTKETINRVTAESRAALEAEKTAKQQAMLQQAVERVMQTYSDSFTVFDQILNRSSASIEQINQRLDKISRGLSGFSATAKLEENINVLRNPKAFSTKERDAAFSNAASSFPGMEKTFKQIADYGTNAEKAVRENLKSVNTDRPDQGAVKQDQIAVIRKTFDKQINEVFKGDETLKRAVETILEEATKDAEKGFLDIDSVIKQIVESTGGQLGTTVENLLIKSQQQLIDTFDKIKASAQAIANINQEIIDRNAAFTAQTTNNSMAYREALGQRISPQERLRLNLSSSAQRLGIGLAPGQTLNANIIADRRSQLEQQRSTKQQELAKLTPDLEKNKSAEEAAKAIDQLQQELAKLDSAIETTNQELEKFGNTIQSSIDETINKIADRAKVLEENMSFRREDYTSQITSTPEQRIDAATIQRLTRDAIGGNYNIGSSPGANKAYNEFMAPYRQEMVRLQSVGAQFTTQGMQEVQRVLAEGEKVRQQAFAQEIEQIINNFQRTNRDPEDPQQRAQLGQLLQNLGKAQGIDPALIKQVAEEAQMNAQDRANAAKADQKIIEFTAELKTLYTDQATANKALNEESNARIIAIQKDVVAPTLEAVTTNTNLLKAEIKRLSDAVTALAAAGGKPVPVAAAPAVVAGGNAKGGLIYANRGMLVDYQPKGTDTVPAMLTPGEFVVNKDATQKNLGLLRSINSGSKAYSKGGVVYAANGGEILARYNGEVKKWEEDFAAKKARWTDKPPEFTTWLRNQGYDSTEQENAIRARGRSRTRAVRDRQSLQTSYTSQKPPTSSTALDTYNKYGPSSDADIQARFNTPVPERGGIKKIENNRLGQKIYYNDGTVEQLIQKDEISNQNQALETLVVGPAIGKGISLAAKGLSRFIPKKIKSSVTTTTQEADSLTPDAYKWFSPETADPDNIRDFVKAGLNIPEAKAARASGYRLLKRANQIDLVDSNGNTIRRLTYGGEPLNPTMAQATRAAIREARRYNQEAMLPRRPRQPVTTNSSPRVATTTGAVAAAGVIGTGIGTVGNRFSSNQQPSSTTTASRQDVVVRPTSRTEPKKPPKPVVSDNNRGIIREEVPSVTKPEVYGAHPATASLSPFNFEDIDPTGSYDYYKAALARLDSELKTVPKVLFYTTDWYRNVQDANYQYYKAMEEKAKYRFGEPDHIRFIESERARILQQYQDKKALVMKRISETASPFDPEYKPAAAMQNEKEANPMPQTAPSSRNDARSEVRKPRNAKEARQMEAERLDKAGIDSQAVNLDRSAKEAMFKKHFEAINKQINIPISNKLAYLTQIANDPRFVGNPDLPEINRKINGLSGLLISEGMLKAAYGLYRIPEIVPDIAKAQQEITNRVKAASALLKFSGSRREFLQTGVPVAAQNRSKGGLIYASNGMMVPYEPKGTDTVPAMLTPGEFVVNRESTQKNLGLLKAINKARGGKISMEELQMLTGTSRAGNYFISPDDPMFIDGSSMRSRPWARGGEKEATDQYYYMQKLFEEYWSKPQMRRYRSTPEGQAKYDKMRKMIATGFGLDAVGRPVFNNPFSKYGDPASHAKDLETIFGRLPQGMSYSSSTNAAGGNALMNQWRSNGGLIYASQGQLVNYQPRGSDTVPAMLTPGEFVVNKESTQKNLGLLTAINKSRGGVIYARDGVEVGAGSNSSYGSMGATTVNFSIPQDIKDQLSSLTMIKLDPAAITSLNSFKTDFSNIVQRLNNLNINIPAKIEMVGTHQVNVTIDAPALENMIPGIESMVASSVSSKMEQIWNQSGGELGPTPTMYG